MTRRFPATRPVLERYGLGDCGGPDGPDEPLAWFATVHRLPLDEFLRDVRAAAVTDIAAAPPDAAAKPPSPFSPHFVIGSLFLTLTLGATTGMINLLRIAAGGDVPIDHRQIHGHTQVLGFAALFLMGIAYHALPRILGHRRGRSLASCRSRRASGSCFSASSCVTSDSRSASTRTAGCCRLLSAGMELASAVLFVRFVFALLTRVREGKYDRKDPLLRFVRAGTVCFGAAMAVVAAQGLWLAGNIDSVLPASLNEAFYFVALYGFLLAWIYGFGHRLVSLFLGVGPAARGRGVRDPRRHRWRVCCSTRRPGFPASRTPAALALRDAGLGLAAFSALVFLARQRLPLAAQRPADAADPGHPHLRDPRCLRVPGSLGGPRALGRVC